MNGIIGGGKKPNQKIVGYEAMLNEAFLKEAKVDPLVCDKCGGDKFVMYEVVEAVSIKVPNNIGDKKNKVKSKEISDISHRTVQRIFTCVNPECKSHVVGVINYGSEIEAIKKRIAESGKNRKRIIVPNKKII